MKIAVNGCCHGELDALYSKIFEFQRTTGEVVDLLVCCGDFEAMRNERDLLCMACPSKFRHLVDFHKYFSREKTAPILTVVIGGNHEASNVMQELYYGGWLAPNIFYLGAAGAVRVGRSLENSIRIAGVSGIYDHRDAFRGYFELPPYDESSIRTVYHTRRFEIDKLLQLKEHVDVFLSHDWPRGIEQFGDVDGLLRRKKHLLKDIQSGRLGSPFTQELLHTLKPRLWFSGHLHCFFPAVVPHQHPRVTRFFAVDKPLPGRQFVHFVDVPVKGEIAVESPQLPQVFADAEWLAITKQNIATVPIGRGHVQACVTPPSSELVAEIQQLIRSDATWPEFECSLEDHRRSVLLRLLGEKSDVLKTRLLRVKSTQQAHPVRWTGEAQTDRSTKAELDVPLDTNEEELDIDI